MLNKENYLIVAIFLILFSCVFSFSGNVSTKKYDIDLSQQKFELQEKYIKELSRKGIILAISSKNNFNDVKKCFEYNKTKMPLKLDDFSCIRVNWNEESL